MGYHKVALLNTSENAVGEACAIHRHQRLLFVVHIQGQANCTVQARQLDGDWKTLETFAASGELNTDNYGWHEVRATASGMQNAKVNVDVSWR